MKLAVIPVEFALAVVGALVAVRTGNSSRIAVLAAGTAGALCTLMGAYAAPVPSAALAAASAAWIFPVVLGIDRAVVVPDSAAVLPDGRPPSPRWRPVVWLAIIAGLGLVVTAALSNVDFSSDFPRLRIR